MSLQKAYSFLNNLGNSETMPSLFLGHGSPMNAIEENQFVKGFRNVAKEIAKPKAILCISAHWLTQGTKATAMEMPSTIHDFQGFPQELFNVQYPASGLPELASEIKNIVQPIMVEEDHEWGLDHGAWSVIKHLYPDANIPVVQLSIDYYKPLQYHFDLAKKLRQLREKGVLIIGSGNIVHNLKMIDWKNINSVGVAWDWAKEAKYLINNWVLNGDFDKLINYDKYGLALQYAIPTPDHFIPLLYALALKRENDSVELFNDEAIGGSLTMTSVKIG